MDVFPTAYFGSIQYYKMLVASENPVIETKEHFIKQTCRSRCEILGPNGKQTLSVTTKKVNGSKTVMDEMEIIDDEWRKNHWKSLETAYASSAYFDFYGTEVNELIFNSEKSLLVLNNLIHKRIISWLELPITVEYSQSFVENIDLKNDYRAFDFSSMSNEKHGNYTQVFAEKKDTVHNLSMLDLVFNQGPMARNWIVFPN